MNGNLLRGEIAARGYTLRELANLSGISRTSLSAKINGKRPFDTDEVVRLCEVLGITDPVKKIDIFLTTSSQIRDNATA